MRYTEIINEAKVDPSHLAQMCQEWLDSGVDMTAKDFKAILSSELAQSCKPASGAVIYRGIAPVRSRVNSFAKTGKLVFASKRPIVAYSTQQRCAKAAADFTKSGDEITMVFKKEAPATDILLDFTMLLTKLRAMGFNFTHDEDDDEHELWLNASNKFYTTFTKEEMVYYDDAFTALEPEPTAPSEEKAHKEKRYAVFLKDVSVNGDTAKSRFECWIDDGKDRAKPSGAFTLDSDLNFSTVNLSASDKLPPHTTEAFMRTINSVAKKVLAPAMTNAFEKKVSQPENNDWSVRFSLQG